MFAVLDELKNMKSSVKNDYSAYRRYERIKSKIINDIVNFISIGLRNSYELLVIQQP